MSADNGIYILKTAARVGGGYEYRVTHAQAIENIYYDVASGEQWEHFIPEIAFQYFGDCQVYKNEDAAGSYAHLLAQSYPILEYGVCGLDHPKEFFQTFATEQLEFFEAEAEAVMERHRQEREVEREAKLEAATIRLPAGTKVLPGHCAGVLFVTPEGEEIRGTLKLSELTLAEDTDFLPNGWFD